MFDGGGKFRMHCTTIFDGEGKDLEVVGDGYRIPVPVFFKGALVSCIPLLASSFRRIFASNAGSGIKGNRITGPVSNEVWSFVGIRKEVSWFV